MTDLHVRFLRLVAHRIERELDDYDSVEHSGDEEQQNNADEAPPLRFRPFSWRPAARRS